MADLRSDPGEAENGGPWAQSRRRLDGWSGAGRSGCGLRDDAGQEQTPDHLLTGLAGEDAAFFYLRRKGYTVVARRWSAGNVPGDVDLIAWQGQLLCIVEVKTRTARDMTPAEAAVDGNKRRMLRRLARRYVRQLPQAELPPVRFDVISVYLVPGEKTEFMHFENAFGWDESAARLADKVRADRARSASVLELLVPGHLDGFELRLVRLGRVVGEAFELGHVAVQVGEADRERIEVGKLFLQLNADLFGVGP